MTGRTIVAEVNWVLTGKSFMVNGKIHCSQYARMTFLRARKRAGPERLGATPKTFFPMTAAFAVNFTQARLICRPTKGHSNDSIRDTVS
jgi:hypothetical protein